MQSQRLFLFITVVLFCSDFLPGFVYGIDPSECRNVMCPQRDIVCPADSVVLFIPTTPSLAEPIDLHSQSAATSIIGDIFTHDSLVQPLNSSALIDDPSNHTISRRSAEVEAVAKEDKGKRSVPEIDDDELIELSHEIVPIRSLTNETILAVPYVENSGEELMKVCCTQSMCICKPELCPAPKCEPGLVPIVMNHNVGQPGHCCPIFKCDAIPDCQSLSNGHTWRENCRTCLCFGHEAKCQDKNCLAKQHDESPLEDVVHKSRLHDCYSMTLNRPFANGAAWKEGDCDHCQCKDGETKCQTNSCINLICEEQIKIPGECCPKCKDFCDKHEYCDKKCSFGYNVDEATGCRLCECAPLPPLAPKDATVANQTGDAADPLIITGTQAATTTTTATTMRTATTIMPPVNPETKPPIQINIFNNNYHNSTTTTTVAEQEENWNGVIFVALIAFAVGILFGALGCFICMRHRQRKQRSYSTVPSYDNNANPITYKGA